LRQAILDHLLDSEESFPNMVDAWSKATGKAPGRAAERAVVLSGTLGTCSSRKARPRRRPISRYRRAGV